MFEYPKTLIIMKVLVNFSLREGGGFVVKLVAAKVIRQHLFSLHYLISSIKLFERKKRYFRFSA